MNTKYCSKQSGREIDVLRDEDGWRHFVFVDEPNIQTQWPINRWDEFAKIKIEVKNLRFWYYYRNGWVKITLKPGQQINTHYAYTTDEGYHSCGHTFYAYSDSSSVEIDIFNDGRDCDGRLQTRRVIRCKESELKDGGPAFDGWDSDGNDKRDPSIMTPLWEQVHCSQRDFTAESMGY